MGKLNARLENSISGIVVVKSFAAESWALVHYLKLGAQARASQPPPLQQQRQRQQQLAAAAALAAAAPAVAAAAAAPTQTGMAAQAAGIMAFLEAPSIVPCGRLRSGSAAGVGSCSVCTPGGHSA